MKYKSLNEAIQDGLAVRDEDGNYVLPFQGGRFSLDEDHNLVDSGIKNRYPRLVDRFSLIMSNGDGDGSGDGQLSGSALLADYKLPYDVPELSSPTIGTAHFNGDAGPIATVSSNNHTGDIIYCWGDEYVKIIGRSSSSSIQTNDDADYEVIFSDRNYTRSMFTIGRYAYAVDDDNGLLETINYREGGAITTQPDVVVYGGCNGIHTDYIDGKHIIYFLKEVEDYYFYVRVVVTQDEDGILTVVSDESLADNIRTVLGDSTTNRIYLLDVTDGTAIFGMRDTEKVYVTDKLGKELIDEINIGSTIANVKLAWRDDANYYFCDGNYWGADGSLLEYSTEATLASMTKDATSVTVSYVEDIPDISIAFGSGEAPEEEGGTNNNGSLVFVELQPTVVAAPRTYERDKSISLDKAAYTVTDLYNGQINIAYLYALTRSPLGFSDDYLLTPGNISPKFNVDISQELSTDFEWVGNVYEELSNDDGVIGAVGPTPLGIGYDPAANRIVCTRTGEELIAGTNRDKLLVYLQGDVLVEVDELTAYVSTKDPAALYQNKKYRIANDSLPLFHPDAIVEVVPVEGATSAADDTSNDFLAGN